MFSCTIKGAPEHPVAKLSGSLTLEHSRKIHTELLALLSQAEVMTIDLGESDKSDLSFIQMLLALLKDPDKKIRFANLPAHLLDNAARLGADAFMAELSNRTGKSA
ncbi:STAS domain-containing protein [Desulfomicrobium baculatum]|uniref:MlaB-like STAS domain-containing protein n=1 Tax=Desulfomicrobium baculatum (strain DSM 4028 / VKM B-1378 / X) TaxID=525897 RepID=C7LSX6_DESBD|nr:STAS domain-containing protein [Desulfomicrobium baculatum]ACU90726.1 hypothetical protein Dbac_2649 [Desulfomicrobium baculatum DSM 4028]